MKRNNRSWKLAHLLEYRHYLYNPHYCHHYYYRCHYSHYYRGALCETRGIYCSRIIESSSRRIALIQQLQAGWEQEVNILGSTITQKTREIEPESDGEGERKKRISNVAAAMPLSPFVLDFRWFSKTSFLLPLTTGNACKWKCRVNSAS